MRRGLFLLAGLLFGIGPAWAADHQELKTTELAAAFGQLPSMSDVRMSPDGNKISYLNYDLDGTTVLAVIDLAKMASRPITKTDFGKFDILNCRWANKERLLCNVQGIEKNGSLLVPYTRMLAINSDGSKQTWLFNKDQSYTQFATEVIDLLPDDPKTILLQRQVDDTAKLQRVDIYRNKSDTVAWGNEAVQGWMTDGRGQARIRLTDRGKVSRWDFTLAGSDDWHKLYVHVAPKDPAEDKEDDFEPAGFGDDPNVLYFFKAYKGHRALWQRNLASKDDQAETLVYARDDVDVDDLATIGKYRRAYAVSYTTDYSHLKMFDASVDKVLKEIEATLPDKAITVLGESWDRRYYLLKISGDEDAGTYYRLDNRKPSLMKLTPAFPKLAGRSLAVMKPIDYPADDGTDIPGYLTLPPGKEAKNLPLVILPHGGPQSRDSWGFDPLVQFIAAKGYAVLQSNYRGSGGYGEDWAGKGGYKEWRKVVSDLADGAKALIADGTADPKRICAVGWSYGGYAALLSAIEGKGLYKCVVSIAGVTDPETEIHEKRYYTSYKFMRSWLGGGDKDVVDYGSPLKRAEEIQVPVLLFHGTKDMNVSVKNSEKLSSELKKLGKPVDYIEYEDAQHDIWRNAYRIDMLARIGAFLDENIGAGGAK